MTTPVRRLEAAAITPAQFHAQYIEPQRPLLLAGLQAAWPARERWDASYFRARFGDQRVPVREYGTDTGRPYTKQMMSLGDYLDYWEQLDPAAPSPVPNLYLAEWNFTQPCPGLLEDFTTPDYFQPDWIDRLPVNLQFGRLWIFIGHPAVDTPVHTDTFGTSAWLAMVRGSKHVRLIHPDDAAIVTKGMNLFSAEVEQLLHDRGIALHDAVIGEGDTLFIPGRWFHQVRNLDRNIMVTKNFADAANLLGFLSELETRVTTPVRALRALRNQFFGDQLAASGAPRDGAPSCLRSPAFVDDQLRWTDEAVADLAAYRAQLEALRRTQEAP